MMLNILGEGARGDKLAQKELLRSQRNIWWLILDAYPFITLTEAHAWAINSGLLGLGMRK